MIGIQNMDEKLLKLPSDIIKKKKTVLEYLSEKYYLKMQLKIDTESYEENNIIVLSIENENTIETYTYACIIKYEEFKKIGGELFFIYKTIDQIYDYLSYLIDGEKVSIEKIIPNDYLTLALTSKFPGLKDPVITYLKLSKKIRDKDDQINILNRKIEVLEKKNKELTAELESNQKLLLSPPSYPSTVPSNTVPVISKIQIYEKGKYNYIYALSSFTKVNKNNNRTINIPSKKVLFYVCFYDNGSYVISELVNTGNFGCEFEFKVATTTLYPSYYKLIDDKFITRDHWVYLLDDDNHDIQFMKVFTKFKNSKGLVRNGIINYCQYIDIILK